MFTPNLENILKTVPESMNRDSEKLIEEGFFDKCSNRVHCLIDEGKRILRFVYIYTKSHIDYKITVSVSENDEIVGLYCNLCQSLYSNRLCKHTLAIMKLIARKNQKIFSDLENNVVKNILSMFEKLEKEAKQREEEQIKKRNRILFDDFLTQMRMQDVSLLKNKIKIIPIINIFKGEYEEEYFLTLRVGYDKFYLVKDINSFCKSVEENEFVKYGKSLEFNHNINNFDEQGKELILLLLQVTDKNNMYYKVREMILNNYLFEKIITIYQEDYIKITDMNDYTADCFIDPTLTKMEIAINEDDQLILKNIHPSSKLLCGYQHDYLLYNNKLTKVGYDSNDIRLLARFVFQNPQFKLSDVKRDFASNIYPRIYDLIEVNEKFQKKYPIAKLNITSYFDYENGIISLSTKYNLNGENVILANLNTNQLYSRKLNLYNNLIQHLGFENNEIKDINKIGMFFQTDFSKLQNVSTIYLSENIKSVKIRSVSKSNFNIKLNAGILTICLEKSEFSDDELHNILNAYRRKKKYIKLDNNTIVSLENSYLQSLNTVVEELGLDDKHLSSFQNKPSYQALKLNNENVKFNLDNNVKELLKEIKEYKNSDFLVPSHLQGVLRKYQVEGYKWLKVLMKYGFCGILADDMGLGKTLQIICAIYSDEVDCPSLIVCPKSLLYNWKNEIEKWGNNLEAVVVSGVASERINIINKIASDKKKIYITSYDSLKNDLEYYKIKFRFMILDEAQFIKNHTTLKAQSVKMISSQLKFVLTGTPIENTIVDLWSLFDFLMPNYLFNYNTFKDRFEKQIMEKNNKEAIELLVKKITPFILRRTKQDVLTDLPPKIENVIYVDMEESQRKVYDAYVLQVRDLLNTRKNKIEILSSLTRLRQLCVNPKLFLEDYIGASCKINRCLSIIEEAISANHKVIVFSQFVSSFEEVEKQLNENNIMYYKLTGSTKANERMRMVDDFNKYDEAKVFLISLKAGGTGLNLIGADTVIHLDPWWNISVENQATDRAHRIGQKNSVQVIKLICSNTIEQKVIELQKLKQDLVNKVIVDGDINIQKLSSDDLNYLIS